MYKYLVILILFFIPMNLSATHLVGGEMNYKYLGDDTYEFSLKVYRDCYLGVPDFDYPAYIGVYSASGVFQGIYVVYGSPKTLLPVELDDECYSAPPNVCVERKEYRFQGYLEDNGEGYYVSYQRCCRNATILNIYDDATNRVEDSGMNLYAFVPSPSKIHNSNPVFKEMPPIAICVNKPLVFDHSAIDEDGDSLVYKLCTPTDALSPDIPSIYSNYYDQVPFHEVRWRNPYSLGNVLGGSEPLKIDSKTGLLVGYPDKIGQFVVGVCVEEYRDGKMIGETKRDFQFNVAQCGKTSVSSFFTYDTICNNLDIQFENQSIQATNFIWDFGDGTTSTLQDPQHSFAEYGSYKITLIASSDQGCADTSSHTIVLTEDDYQFQTKDVTVCKGQSAMMEIQSNTSQIQYVKWGLTPVVYNQSYTYTFLPQQSQTVPVEIKSQRGCIYTGEINVTVQELPNSQLKINPEELYNPQNVNISSSFSSDYSYKWMTDNGANLPDQSSLDVWIDHSQWVKVEITDKKTGCKTLDSIFVEIKKCTLEAYFVLDKDTFFNCDEILIQHRITALDTVLQYFWVDQNGQTSSPQYEVQLYYDVKHSYYLVTQYLDQCSDTLIFEDEFIRGFEQVYTPEYIVCEGTTFLQIPFVFSSDVVQSIVIHQTDTLTSSDTWQLFLNGQKVSIPIEIVFQDSCSVLDTIYVKYSDVQVQASAQPTVALPGQTVTLSALPSNFPKYQWSPEEFLNINDEAVVTAVVDETTNFVVMVTDVAGCMAYDTVRVEILDDRCGEENIFIPTAFTPNGDGVNDMWMVRTLAPVSIQVAIYDRWGEKVFDSDDIEIGWDGTFRDKPAAAGSYSYYIQVVCENQLTYFSKGNITLIR